MAIQKAKRIKVCSKTLLTGPSGSGKTQSALEIATGIAKKCGGEGILFIGTEGDRDKLYAEQKSRHGGYTFEYDLLQLSEPYSTDSFIAAIDEGLEAGYKVIIIDSISAEWKYLNDLHDKMPGNSFTNWSKLKPKHRQLIDKILNAQAHIIVCARGKDEWVLEEKNGKQVPKKVGLGSQTDKDISYEMMLSLQLDQDTHVAHADKDNTGLWGEDRFTVITAKDGEALYDWCENGITEEKKTVPIQKSEDIIPTDEVEAIKKQIIERATALGGNKSAGVKAVVKEFGNPNALKTVEDAQKYLDAINNIKE